MAPKVFEPLKFDCMFEMDKVSWPRWLPNSHIWYKKLKSSSGYWIMYKLVQSWPDFFYGKIKLGSWYFYLRKCFNIKFHENVLDLGIKVWLNGPCRKSKKCQIIKMYLKCCISKHFFSGRRCVCVCEGEGIDDKRWGQCSSCIALQLICIWCVRHVIFMRAAFSGLQNEPACCVWQS